MSETLHIVCTNCDAVNRIPASRLGDRPKCGKCHQSLFNGHQAELTPASFQQHISRNDIPSCQRAWATAIETVDTRDRSLGFRAQFSDCS